MMTLFQAKALGRAVLTTNDAANALGYQPQTLRKWASLGTGPISPVRIGGRLAWKVADIEQILNTEAR